MKQLTILGATGSIGRSTLEVLRLYPERYRVYALTAHTDWKQMRQLCREFLPRYAVMADSDSAQKLRQELSDAHTEVLSGAEALSEVSSAEPVDIVMAAIVGAAGLLPSLAAVQAGKRVLLANKEALVMTGQLMMQEAERHNATLLPVDSEHNAMFQCLPGGSTTGLPDLGVTRLLLTASGGPFRDWPLERFAEITPEQALKHPNWSMGPKITIDSATMMNKGLELIEACWLFHTQPDKVDIVVHRQSIVHSMVAYSDGSVLAQMGNPDMRTPIAHVLAWPERIRSGVEALDLRQVAQLDFEAADERRFPCLRLAREAVEAGGSSTTVLNAANEVAVQAFLEGRCAFMDIPRWIEDALQAHTPVAVESIDAVLEIDQQTRRDLHQKQGLGGTLA